MKNILLTLLLFILFSCKSTGDKIDCEVLHVDLVERPVPTEELFSKISVIPLETNDSSFLVRPVKVIIKDNRYYIVDEGVPAVFSFDEEGHLLHKIGKKGQGPGEYREIYDAVIKEKESAVYMLSPFGSLYVYSLDGKFIKEIKLPTRSNYQLIEELDSKYFVTWTLPASENENCISVISKESFKNVKEFWHVPPVLTTLNSKPFYNYEHKVYFSNPYQNEVYEVRTDSLRVAYRWDFGKDNLDLKEYGFTLLEDQKVEEYKLMLQYLRDSTVPYFLCDQYQNDKFYYIMLVFGLKHSKNLFYRKEDGKSFFFEKTTEDIHFEPLAFNEDFLTCIVFNEDFPNYEKVLPPEEYKKLEERLEDDNPCLIKFYFK